MKRTAPVKFLSAMFGAHLPQVFVTSLANDRNETRRIPPRQVMVRDDPSRIETFAAEWDKPEPALYFCVAALKPGQTWRNKENLGQLVCLHADLDFKNITVPRQRIERVLDTLRLPPHWVIFSGHGLHCYWLLDKPLSATAYNIAHVEHLLRKLAELLAGDPQVCEASRLMRLPGSHNTKFDSWVEVTINKQRRGRYSLKQLEIWLASDIHPRLNRRAQQTRRDNPWLTFAEQYSARAPIDVEQRLAEMQHHGPGDSSIHNTQRSVTAALLSRGYPLDTVVARVLKATVIAAGHTGKSWNWQAEENDLRYMCRKWLEKHPRVFFCEDD